MKTNNDVCNIYSKMNGKIQSFSYRLKKAMYIIII